MTETFKSKLEASRHKAHTTGWKGEPLPQTYWDRLNEDLERTAEQWDALIAEGQKKTREARAKLASKGILFA